MSRVTQFALSLLCFTLGLWYPAGAARAQADIEEIIVSGFRPLQGEQVAASVAVLGEEILRRHADAHFENLTHLVPNLNWAGGASRPRYFQIRGIGERSQYEGAPNPSVGFIIDDMDFSGMGGIATLFDAQQVEVLRGPQGTRYGANALAGLIYVKYRPPTRTPEAYVTGSAGNDNAHTIGAVVSGPLTAALSYRAVVHSSVADGFRDNAYLARSDTNGRDELSTRLKLRYAPSAQLQLDLTALHADMDNGYDAFAIDNGLTTWSDRPGRDAQRTSALALKAQAWLSDAVSLVSISSASRSDVTFSFDADWGNSSYWAPFVYDFFSATRRDRQTLAQELRLVSAPDKRLDWVAGVSISDLRESNITRDDGNYEGDAFVAQIAREYEATSSAAFGDMNVAVNDHWSVGAGLRIERRDAAYMDSQGDQFAPRETNLGGQVTLRFAPGAGHAFYARAARGYKAGGFNLGLPAQADDNTLLYDAEHLWNFEAGANSLWLDGRLRTSASVFWMQRRDQQVQTSAQLDPNNPATFVFFTDNAGKGRNRGIELGADMVISSRLSAFANVGVLDTRIDDLGSTDARDGRDQAHAPPYSFAVGGRVDLDAGWFVRTDVTGKGDFYFSDSHDQKSAPYTLVNLHVGIERDNWSVVAWARNVFNEKYAVRGFYFGNEPARDFAPTLYTRLGDPRQVGVSATYRFAH